MRAWLTEWLRPLLRKYPFVRGRARIVCGLMGAGGLPPDGRIVSTRWGTRIRLKPDLMYRDVFLWGDYEPSQTRLFREIVRTGDVVADVGTNFGWYATLFARWVGSSGRVHAFEPIPSFRALAQENLALNLLTTRVSLNEMGLGEKAGEFTVHTFSGLPSGHASVSDLGRADAVPHHCRVEALDAYVRRVGLERLDFMKIDVEGFERDVLAGAMKVLCKEDAPVVAFEVNMDCLGHLGLRAGAAADELRTAGYRFFYRINPYGGATRFDGVLPEDNADYIAAKPGRVGLLAAAVESARRTL